MMKRIVIIGPESTGKSTLCQQLADHYKTAWCPEFARAYLLEKGMNYDGNDLDAIAHGQMALEAAKEIEARNSLYFIDTDLYVMKVWYEVVFQACPSWILKTISKKKYDLYLLCNTDLPWVKDALREYPDLKTRRQLFMMYKDAMINSNTRWAEIGGTDQQRLQAAIDAIEAI